MGPNKPFSKGWKMDSQNTEKWSVVNGFGDYAVSSMGRVKRIQLCPGSWVGRILKQKTDKDGYNTLNLSKNGAIKTVKVHRLVADAFIQKSHKTHDQVNHKDGVKSHNDIGNLEWCDQSKNHKHAFAMGLNKPNCKPQKGEKNGATKLKNCEVWLIKKLIHHHIKTSTIIKMFKTNKYVISDIRRGKSWKCVHYSE